MAGKRLTNAMIEHGGKCFYCGEYLPLERASVDHVVPTALGGANRLDNRVYCCVSINQWFGCASLKAKLHWLLQKTRQREPVCPEKQH